MSGGNYTKLNIQWVYLGLIGFLLVSIGSEEVIKQAKHENNEAIKLAETETVQENSEDLKEDANVLSTGGRTKPPSQTLKKINAPSADTPKIIEQPKPPVAEVPVVVIAPDVEKSALNGDNKEEVIVTEDNKPPTVIETIQTQDAVEESKSKETVIDDSPLKELSSQNEAKPLDLGNTEDQARSEKKDASEVVSEEKAAEEEEVKTEAAEAQKTEEEEIVGQEAGEDMVSFDEWKKKRLAEQAELDRKDGSSKSPTSTVSQSKVKTSKNRINFGSATCGAKILTSNNGAQNPAYLLTENKDQYMINSCKAKKWFIVELCEPVQVHSIELGNLELFSSLPQEYPSKDWKSLGVFHARDERSIQSFSVGDNQIYAKYLKVEMITHYGQEHFCTLSILRVFGSTVVEDDDDNDEESTTHMEPNLDPEISDDMLLDQDSDGTETENDEKSSNLFSSATDTVLSLVNTVLSHKDEAIDQKSLEEEVKEGVSHNVSTKNVTPPVVKEEQAGPCPPDARVNSEPKADAALSENSLPEPPDPSVDVSSPPCTQPPQQEKTDPEDPAPIEDIPIVTIIDPKDYSETVEENDLIRLIEKPKTLQEILTDCSVCSDVEPDNHCSVRLSTTCAYHALWWKEKIQKEVVEPIVTTKEPVSVEIKNEKSLVDELQPSITISNSVEQRNTETLSDEVTEAIETSTPALVDGISSNATEKVEMEATVIESSEVEASNEEPDSKVIYAEQSGDLHLESVPPPNADDMQYQKLRSRGKETLLMRLKNRVTDLELNLSLSSRYLEELSQRYKRQMEEMYRSLNKTITKFSNVTKSTEQRGSQQQVHIKDLQVQLSDVTLQLLRLESSVENLSTALVERQFTFLFVEVIVFTVILSLCLGRHRGVEQREVAPPVVVPAKRGGHTRAASLDVSPDRPRGVSFSGCPRQRTDTERTKSGSEGNLNIIPLNAVLVPPVNEFEANRNKAKKKKRKSNPLPASMLTGDKIPLRRASEAPMASAQHSPSAGVIFNHVRNKALQNPAVKTQLSFNKQNGCTDRSRSCEQLRKTRSMEKEPNTVALQQKRRGKIKGEGVEMNGHSWSNGAVEDIGRRKYFAHQRNIDAMQ